MSISKTRKYSSGLIEVDVDFNKEGRLRLRDIQYKGDTVNGVTAGIYFDLREVILHLENIQEIIDREGQAMSDFKDKIQDK